MALTFNWSTEVSVALRLAFRPCKPLNAGSIPEFSSHLDETCCCLYQRFRQVCIVSTGCIRTLFFPGRDLCKLTKKKRLILLAVLSVVTILYLTYSDVMELGYRMAVSQGIT